MASLRKRYQTQDAPVMSPPQITAAELPEPVADAKPPEPVVESSPAEEAGKAALRQRLEEMERAEKLARQPQQQPQHASEPPQQQQPAMPARVQEWLSRHPQYMDPNDQIAQVEISLATMKAARDGLTWNDDDFLPSIERHLGIRQAQTNGQPHKPTPQPANHAPRPAAPQRQPQPMRPGRAFSAPPSREPPSMATGRVPNYRAALNRDELEIAAASGQTPEQYQAQKERMLRMKAEGYQ